MTNYVIRKPNLIYCIAITPNNITLKEHSHELEFQLNTVRYIPITSVCTKIDVSFFFLTLSDYLIKQPYTK